MTPDLGPMPRPHAESGDHHPGGVDAVDDDAKRSLTQPRDLQSSTPNSSGPRHAVGGMGVSSERVGHAGPVQQATDGVRDVAPPPERAPDDTPPEQSPGNPEENPEGIAPKAGYPSKDPRSDQTG